MANFREFSKVLLKEHEMVVDGVLLKETEEISTVGAESEDESAIQTIVTLTQRIGNRIYQVIKTKNGDQTDTEVKTTMSEEEVQQFKDDWKKMWTPKIDEDEAAKEIGPTLAMEKKDINEDDDANDEIKPNLALDNDEQDQYQN